MHFFSIGLSLAPVLSSQLEPSRARSPSSPPSPHRPERLLVHVTPRPPARPRPCPVSCGCASSTSSHSWPGTTLTRTSSSWTATPPRGHHSPLRWRRLRLFSVPQQYHTTNSSSASRPLAVLLPLAAKEHTSSRGCSHVQPPPSGTH
jgi:hypothetical protein